MFTVIASHRIASIGYRTFAKNTGRTDAREMAKRLVASPDTTTVMVYGPRFTYIWTSPIGFANGDQIGGKWWIENKEGQQIDPKTLEVIPERQCEHGLSEWLCEDPINHYPADH